MSLKEIKNINELDQESESEEYSEEDILITKSKPTKRWGFDIVCKLKDYAFQAAGSSWVHGEDAAYYNSVDKKITITSMILTGIAIALSSLALFVESKDTTVKEVFFYIFLISVIILNLVDFILKGYQKIKNFVYKIAENSEKSSKFGDLFRKITDQFVMDPEDREDAITLMEYTRSRFNELEREKPFTRVVTRKLWEEHLKSIKTSEDYENIIKLPQEFRLVNGQIVELKNKDETIIDIKDKSIKPNTKSKKNKKIERFINSMV